MRKIYVKGDFYPLNYDEIDAIRKIHRVNRDSLIYLICDNDYFIDNLNNYCLKYNYLFLANKNSEADITLGIHIPLDIDNIYKYYNRQTIISNIDLMKQLVSKKMSNKRYIHSLGVADESCKLAKRYGYDENKAYLAGLLHDICKEMDIECMNEYLRFYDNDKLNIDDRIKHGYVAKYYLQEKMGIHDKDILNSIYHHTIGDHNSLLSRIVYIADKREVNRNIDDGILELAYIDIDEAFLKLKKTFEEKHG